MYCCSAYTFKYVYTTVVKLVEMLGKCVARGRSHNNTDAVSCLVSGTVPGGSLSREQPCSGVSHPFFSLGEAGARVHGFRAGIQ